MWIRTIGVAAVVSMVMGTSATTEASIQSLAELNEWLGQDQSGQTANGRKVGFLSMGNFHSVQNELHANVEAEVYAHSTDLYDAVDRGDVVAGLVSGTVQSVHSFHVFPSEQISVRAMLHKPGNDAILDAIDAALVRVIDAGGVEECAANNPPYAALVVHSCMADATRYPWPSRDQLPNRSTIRVGALGPWDWGNADGDYTTQPYTGFWPDYYNKIEDEFRANYNMTFERVWFTSSKDVLDCVLNETCDTTEPYMMVGAAYDASTSRKSAFDLSCITSATQDKYFTRSVAANAASSSDDDDAGAWIAAVVVVAVLLTITLLFVGFVLHRERRGEPLFKAALLPQEDRMGQHVPRSKVVAMTVNK